MAKYNYGFTILNKDTASSDGSVVILCTRTRKSAEFAYKGENWGKLLSSDMDSKREADAEAFLQTMGWI